MYAKLDNLRVFSKNWQTASIALILAAGCTIAGSASLAESESGGVYIGGNNESGGFMPVGTGGGNESGGVLWGDGSSESGGATDSGAVSQSGGIAEVGNSSESGGPLDQGSSDENKLQNTNYKIIIKNYKW